jgi:nitrite reductase/ring-hydroxylating ferredoxin subunit
VPTSDPTPETPPTTVRVPGAASLSEGETCAFTFERGGRPAEGFILRHALGFYAYANICPHWFVDLDLGFGDFYDRDADRIFCRNHGALFLPTTGECTAGPCAGEFLEQLGLVLDGADAVVTIEPPVLISATNLG